MIPGLPLGEGEEGLEKDPPEAQEDDGFGEESPGDAPQPDSPQPGSPVASQPQRDQIQPPNDRLHFSQLPTQSLKEKSQPAPWEPDYKKETAGNCGPGTSTSYRTIWHPSFYALYDAQGQDLQTLVPPEMEGNQDSSLRDEGFPALGSEDFFFSDPLLPSIDRIPLSLPHPPQQVLKRSRRLVTPPPIMSVWPQPILTWQSGPEITAISSLLEMSQGGTESAPPPSKAS